MSAPYWTGDGIELYHGDCLEIAEWWLAGDVLVTDPPYGRGWKQGALRPNGFGAHYGIAGDHGTAARDAVLRLWPGDSAIMFGDPMLPPPADTKQVLIYLKPPNAGIRGATAGFRRDVEAIYLIGQWTTGLGGRSSVLTTGARSQGNAYSVAGRYRHPHAKPSDVMQQLISASPAGVVVDPFAGSGSTLEAARMQGRRAIGVEIEERYCEIAARRLDQFLLTEEPMAVSDRDREIIREKFGEPDPDQLELLGDEALGVVRDPRLPQPARRRQPMRKARAHE